MPGQEHGTVLMFRTPSGTGAMYLHPASIEAQLAGLVSGFTPEQLARTEWVVLPDTTVSRARWPT